MKKPKNPYIVGEKPCLVAAHRGGSLLNPENTLKAFEYCVENHRRFQVDFFELDLHLTADDQLILCHDDELDRCTDSEKIFGKSGILVREKTYAQLRLLNFGANFQAQDGSYPYRDLTEVPDNLRALRFTDLLDYLESAAKGRYRYIIDVKHGEDDGRLGADKLLEILKAYGLMERVIFGSLKNEITRYVTKKYPELPRSAGINETIWFYLRSLIGIPMSKKRLKYIALQVPTSYKNIQMDLVRFVKFCHKHNLSAQYWTINDREEMRKLLALGADVLMGDLPDVIFEEVHGITLPTTAARSLQE